MTGPGIRLNFRAKLVVGLLGIVGLTGALSLVIGINVINRNVIREAYASVRNSLSATDELYQEEAGKRLRIVEYLSKTEEIARATEEQDRAFLRGKLAQIKTEFAFDIVNVVNPDGSILVRANNFDAWGDSVAGYRYIQSVMRTRQPVAGTGVLGYENIRREGPDLAERTIITVVPTAKARPRDSETESRGLVMKAAAPIVRDGRMVGILYAAVLLNNNDGFIDRFRRLLFKPETIDGRDVGASTLFLGDIRVATTIADQTGKRAIGTQVSEEIYRRVYENGETWIGPAFVVDAWYLSGYSPLIDADGRILGMRYVGILKAKYDAALRRTTALFLSVIIGAILLALALSISLLKAFTKPVQRVITAAGEIARGQYRRIPDVSKDDDARKISTAFNAMVDAVEERDRRLQEQAAQTILKSEKLASIGRLASGIAHEINNPLTGVLTFASLLLEDLKGTEHEEDLKVIRDETLRCRKIVRGVLDFARESAPEKTEADLNEVIDGALRILERNVHFQNIEIVRAYAPDLPPVWVDVSQFKQVVNNLAVNAADAMPDGGRLTITTSWDKAGGRAVVRIADSGVGIPPEHMARLFEPFFTTKDKEKGTGLGLAVVYGVIESHGGTIDVRSRVGEGTEFTVSLPAA